MNYEDLTPEQKATYTEYIKVNLPTDEESAKHSTGEGVWCMVTPQAKTAHDTDEQGSEYEGILANDSLYYPGLEQGETIPILMQGEKRPIVPLKWLFEHYGNPNPAWTGAPENE